MSSEMRELVAQWRDEAANPNSHIPAAGLLYCADALEALLEDDDEECPHTMKSQDRDGSVMCCDCGTLLARTEAGADGADMIQWRYTNAETGEMLTPWTECDAAFREKRKDAPGYQFRELFTHPQDASGDAESTALYLRPYDVTMIGQAKHAGQDMVSVLAHLHPTEGWDVRFNVAMQAKEAK